VHVMASPVVSLHAKLQQVHDEKEYWDWLDLATPCDKLLCT
jgi:hypothetical protein